MIPKKSLFALATTLGGLPVLSTLPNSPAARAGVRYGDIVLSVNGRLTPTVDDYVEASALRRDGMDIVFFRAGIEERVTLVYEDTVREPNFELVVAQIVEQRALSEIPGPRTNEGDD